MPKKHLVGVAHVAMGCTSVLFAAGCASDDTSQKPSVYALAAVTGEAVNAAGGIYSDESIRQTGGSYRSGIPGNGITDAQTGEPVSFTGEGLTRR